MTLSLALCTIHGDQKNSGDYYMYSVGCLTGYFICTSMPTLTLAFQLCITLIRGLSNFPAHISWQMKVEKKTEMIKQHPKQALTIVMQVCVQEGALLKTQLSKDFLNTQLGCTASVKCTFLSKNQKIRRYTQPPGQMDPHCDCTPLLQWSSKVVADIRS